MSYPATLSPASDIGINLKVIAPGTLAVLVFFGGVSHEYIDDRITC